MNWFHAYLASIVPAIFIFSYLAGRQGTVRAGPPLAILYGVTWPLMVPLTAFIVLLEYVVELGAKSNK